MDLLSLHFRESRLEEFKRAQDIFFSPDLKQWIVFKPELVVELLRDERLIVPNMVEAVQMLENRYKRKFPNLTFAVSRIPLLLNGEVHRDVRCGQADMVTQGRASVTAALPELMRHYVEPMDRQANPDWITSTFIPLVGDVFCIMCNCPRSLPFPKLVISRLFDRFVSLAALDAAEQQIALLRLELAKTAPNADPALVVPLFIIGRDTLVGTLATSFYSILRQNLNRRFADIEFPDFPPETGVPIAERIAADNITIGPHAIAAGDRIRMYFQPISSADGAVARQNLFGTGAHSCLGRAISLDVWRALTNALNRFSSSIASISCEFEPSNIFVTPRYLKTEHHQ
jgi:hypothetical protein